MHWLPGPIAVRAGEALPLTACHNTVGFRFEVGNGLGLGPAAYGMKSSALLIVLPRLGPLAERPLATVPSLSRTTKGNAQLPWLCAGCY